MRQSGAVYRMNGPPGKLVWWRRLTSAFRVRGLHSLGRDFPGAHRLWLLTGTTIRPETDTEYLDRLRRLAFERWAPLNGPCNDPMDRRFQAVEDLVHQVETQGGGRESQVQPDGMLDDHWRETIAAVAERVHCQTLPTVKRPDHGSPLDVTSPTTRARSSSDTPACPPNVLPTPPCPGRPRIQPAARDFTSHW